MTRKSENNGGGLAIAHLGDEKKKNRVRNMRKRKAQMGLREKKSEKEREYRRTRKKLRVKSEYTIQGN